MSEQKFFQVTKTFLNSQDLEAYNTRFSEKYENHYLISQTETTLSYAVPDTAYSKFIRQRSRNHQVTLAPSIRKMVTNVICPLTNLSTPYFTGE